MHGCFDGMWVALRELHALERGRVRHVARLAAIATECDTEPVILPDKLQQRLELLGQARDLLAELAAGRAQVIGWEPAVKAPLTPPVA